MKFPNETLPDLYLEKYLLGDLSAVENQEMELKIRKDITLQQRIAEMKVWNTEFSNNPEFADHIRIIESKAKKQRHKNENTSKASWQFAGAGLAVCLVIVMLVPNTEIKAPTKMEEDFSISQVRFKGISPELKIYRKHKTYIEEIKNNQKVKTHDVLQLGFQGAGYQYGVIFSIDGRGVVTLHYPENKQESTRLKVQGDVALPHAYELDDAPKFERFFLILSNSILDVDEILKKGEQLANSNVVESKDKIAISEAVYQASIILAKEK